ncbi:MAG: hydroxymethylglutaryl-CoA synthase [Candidatus Levybacteria bacterium]|nr:hydroxymethylglutaryl-CoA synthase [Candidatus Levybacteria bacterium]
MVGIVSYGTYIPKYRIKIEDIAEAWQKNPADIIDAMRIKEKAVPNTDEDAITMGVEATVRALKTVDLDPKKLESVYVGSESHPYAVNPSSTIIAEALGMGNSYMAVDTKFACKAGTAALQATAGLIVSKRIRYGLVISSDTAQAKPHDVLEYSAASVSASYILGGGDDVIATIEGTSSFSSNTPDFWRRDGVRYPSHFGRFTGQPAYFAHVLGEGMQLLDELKMKPQDFDYCVFHMPNGKFPRAAAAKLGFTKEQLLPSLTVDSVGNPYTASALLGLAAVLDIAKPGAKIFFVSYGSGAGSDGFIFETTKHLKDFQKKTLPVVKQIAHKEYISYLEYLQKTHKL